MALVGQVNNYPPLNGKTILFFTASGIPSAGELATIARLQDRYGRVLVRNGANAAATSYGSGSLEPADAVAGTVPAAYTTAIASYPDGNVSLGAEVNPEALSIVGPATFSHTGTAQYYAVKSDQDDQAGLGAGAAITQTDVTAATGMVWTSGTPGTATVGASTGLVTGVAAGTTVLTATYTNPATGGTAVAATKTITLS